MGINNSTSYQEHNTNMKLEIKRKGYKCLEVYNGSELSLIKLLYQFLQANHLGVSLSLKYLPLHLIGLGLHPIH